MSLKKYKKGFILTILMAGIIFYLANITVYAGHASGSISYATVYGYKYQ